MRKLFITLILVLTPVLGLLAQTSDTEQRQMVNSGVDFFVPHYFITLQGGGSYHLGEAKFNDLLSPHVQASFGYQFIPWFSTRLAVSGWESRNEYSYPHAEYKWNYVQASVDAMFNLTPIFVGWAPRQVFNPYVFVGVGVAGLFNNDEAQAANNRYGINFQKLWGQRFVTAIRGGIGADFRLSDLVALNLELNTNMYPDHFNSKLGRRDNKDWTFNAMAGIKFTIGQSYGRTAPTYRPVQQEQQQTTRAFVDVPIEKISFNVNVYFVINQSIIRDQEVPKLTALLKYLNEHPRAFVRLSGYADKETGNPTINMRLSIERSQAVSRYLQTAGIEEWRIRRFAKGDTVQPFDIPEDNRVCICYVYDPDNPEPQKFDY